MRLLLSYLRQRRKVPMAFAVFCAVFAVSFALYHLPLGAVLYPTLVCILLGAGFLAYDFSLAKRKHRTLTELNKLTAAMLDRLPEPCGQDDEDYQAIIRMLKGEVNETGAAASAKYRDLVDYYTVWAHQIKTPITSMRLSLEKEDTPLSRRLSSGLTQIEQYVEMVLAYLRLGADSTDYVFRECALDRIIEQSIARFAGEFIHRGLSLDYTPTGLTVITDDKWLSFVIEQLLSNALKYTPEGRIRICLTEPKTLRVEDTGIGIAPADLPRVFERGYTGFNGRTDKRATGIGLYLCRRVCRGLGIGISITSRPGNGTAVLLDLAQYQLKNE